jgi:hypothetical protein
MATPSNVILVPKAARSSYNPDRLLEKNTLLLNQIRHFHEAEKKLPADQQTGIDIHSVKTESQAAEYVRKITAILHGRVFKAG